MNRVRLIAEEMIQEALDGDLALLKCLLRELKPEPNHKDLARNARARANIKKLIERLESK